MSWIVYRHKNKSNNKSYIGITSQKPEERWGKNGIHYKKHPKFWPAIQTYGWDNFEHIILFTNLTKKEALQKEQEMIQYYNSYNCGYNASKGGDSGFTGGQHKQKTKDKISQSLKKYLANNSIEKEKRKQFLFQPEIVQKRLQGVKNYFRPGSKQAIERVKANKKKIICINTGQVFDSLKEASIWCNINSSGISRCLKGIQLSAGKHPKTKEPLKWKYYNK